MALNPAAAAVPVAPQPFPQNLALPQNTFDQVNEIALYDAYEYCRQHEQEAGNNAKRVMYARCLGHMIREFPPMARNIVADEIIDCAIKEASVDEMAEFYINHLFRFFRQHKGRTPTPSDHPSRDSFEMHSSFFSAAVDPAPTSHSTAKQSALRRDDYRCMVTGYVDQESYYKIPQAHRHAYNGDLVDTQYCHIFPPSTNRNLDPQAQDDPKYSGNVWSIIDGFGNIDVLTELNGGNIHRLSNGLTLRMEIHKMFDDLRLWFEEVSNTLNTYTVCTLAPHVHCLSSLPPHRRVTFSTTTDLELPSPIYLKLHAAVCRVAHMSGAAEYLDSYDRDLEQTAVMARDGSSAELLLSRLQRVLLVA